MLLGASRWSDPGDTTSRLSEALPESEWTSMVTFSCGPASSAVTSKRNALRPFLPRTMAGVLTRFELLVTVNSPASAPAAEFRIISQTAVPPAAMCRLAQESCSADEFTCAAVERVIFADFVTVPEVAEMIAHPVMVGDVVNGSVAHTSPAGTVTETGTLKPALVDLRLMTDALAAGAVKVTLHVPPPPGATEVGEQVNRASEDANGERAIGKETTVCPASARTVVLCAELMAPALIGKFTELKPAGTVTEAGTVSAVGALVLNKTGVPPAGDAPSSWMVQTAVMFGVSVVAEHVMEVGPGALPIMEIITTRLLLPREIVTEVT